MGKEIVEENQSEVFVTQNLGEFWRKKTGVKDSCIHLIYLNKVHSCFLLNTVKKKKWRLVRVTIHTHGLQSAQCLLMLHPRAGN